MEASTVRPKVVKQFLFESSGYPVGQVLRGLRQRGAEHPIKWFDALYNAGVIGEVYGAGLPRMMVILPALEKADLDQLLAQG